MIAARHIPAFAPQYRGPQPSTPIPAPPSPRKRTPRDNVAFWSVETPAVKLRQIWVMPPSTKSSMPVTYHFRRSEEGDHFGTSSKVPFSEGVFCPRRCLRIVDLFFRHAQGIAVSPEKESRQTMALTRILRVLEIRGEGAREGPHGAWMRCTRLNAGVLLPDDRRIQNDRASILKEWKRFLRGE